MTALIATTQQPAMAACTNYNYRAGDTTLNSYTVGVFGTEQVAYSTEMNDIGPDTSPSAGDIFLILNNTDYVQVGWQVGATTDIGYHSDARVFWGEYWPGASGNEVLHSGASLPFGSFHKGLLHGQVTVVSHAA